MNSVRKTPRQLAAENDELRARLEEAEGTLRAMGSGELDAIVVSGAGGQKVYSLEGADHAYRMLVEEMSDGILLMAADGIILSANRRFAAIAKAPSEQVIGSAVGRWLAPDVQTALKSLPGKNASDSYHGESVLTAGDGTTVPVRIAANRLAKADMPDCIGLVVSDLTESRQRQRQEAEYLEAQARLQGQLVAEAASRRELLSVVEDQAQAADALRISAQRYQLLFDSSRDALMTLAPPGWKYSTANQATVEMFGASSVAELLALRPWDVSPALQPDGQPSSEKAQTMIATAMREGSTFSEWQYQRLDGTPFSSDVLLTRMQLGDEVFLQATVRDISERVRMMEAMRRANRALKALGSCSTALVQAAGEVALLAQVCRIVVEEAGYQLAWVGFAEHDPQKTVRRAAYAGYAENYTERGNITWDDGPAGQGPAGRAIRSGNVQLVADALNDPTYALWRDNAARLGYRSVLGLPLASAGKMLGAICIYTSELNAFDAEEITLLLQLANDLAFGISMLRARAENDRGAERLRRGMESTIAALAGTLEMRDAYTAGHQRRVAELAAGIASNMGLAADDIHGIHLAATVHDLGKIQVPSEILAKPTRLSYFEYELVKTHAQAGYELLKDIDFPWPIAQMVWQHHERLDGSGYPRGLHGEEILIGARIIAVADVVEAMSAHRPYRPGLGVEQALSEISKGRGTIYDAAAADACIRLFGEQRFAFSA